jgi:hypothetical protein
MLWSIVRHLFDRFVETQGSHGWWAAVGLVFRATLLFALASSIYVAATFCVLFSVVLATVFPLAPPPSPSELPDRRSDYKEYDLTGREFESFYQEYEAARRSPEPWNWTQDPKFVASCVAGYPVYGARPHTVKDFRPEPGKATVVVIDTNLSSDSTEAMKVRVDLLRDGEAWVVEWAGGQWRCHWGRGQWFWAPSFCV